MRASPKASPRAFEAGVGLGKYLGSGAGIGRDCIEAGTHNRGFAGGGGIADGSGIFEAELILWWVTFLIGHDFGRNTIF